MINSGVRMRTDDDPDGRGATGSQLQHATVPNRVRGAWTSQGGEDECPSTVARAARIGPGPRVRHWPVVPLSAGGSKPNSPESPQ
jgi:hypothetical protein